jgi:hypothetical protein
MWCFLNQLEASPKPSDRTGMPSRCEADVTLAIFEIAFEPVRSIKAVNHWQWSKTSVLEGLLVLIRALARRLYFLAIHVGVWDDVQIHDMSDQREISSHKLCVLANIDHFACPRRTVCS